MQSQKLHVMISSMSILHMRHLLSMPLINLALQESIATGLCHTDHVKAPSL